MSARIYSNFPICTIFKLKFKFRFPPGYCISITCHGLRREQDALNTNWSCLLNARLTGPGQAPPQTSAVQRKFCPRNSKEMSTGTLTQSWNFISSRLFHLNSDIFLKMVKDVSSLDVYEIAFSSSPSLKVSNSDKGHCPSFQPDSFFYLIRFTEVNSFSMLVSNIGKYFQTNRGLLGGNKYGSVWWSFPGQHRGFGSALYQLICLIALNFFISYLKKHLQFTLILLSICRWHNFTFLFLFFDNISKFPHVSFPSFFC